MDQKKKHLTSIGGQAVMEGVMMRGVNKTAVAVRNTDGEIVVEELKFTNIKSKYPVLKLPIIRGAIGFVESMILGYKSLTRSAELAGLDLEDEEPSKFEKWLSKTTGKNILDIVMYVAIVLGMGFAVLLFTILPAVTTSFTDKLLGGALGGFKTLVEGVIRLTIFLIYLSSVAMVKDIKRIFEYHGAEHKTIHTYENGEELTVENVKKCSTKHPRCGTSFLLIVMVISILVFSLPIVPWNNILLRIVIKLSLLPIVAGISYEIIKFAGRYDNILTRIISYPGILLQNITTKEPDDSQIEVAIASLNAVLTDNKEEDKW
jgi:uncharacterized protein YqhQ